MARIGLRVTLLCGGIIVAAAAAIVAMLFAMRRGGIALAFWHERVLHVAQWWPRILVVEIIWSVALIALVTALLIAGIRMPKRFARALLAGQVVLLGLFLSAPIPLDADQYAYVASADLTNLRYGPHGAMVRGVPLPHPVLSRDRYGPAFTLGTAVVLRPFRAANLETQARVLRALAALASLAVTLLLWGELQSRRSGLAALAAFALNPVVITQTALDAHNDIVAVLFAVAAYRFARHERYLGAALSLGLSVAWKIDFAPFILPLLAFAFGRSRRPAIAFAATLLVLAVPLVCALPFGWRESLLRPYQDGQFSNLSLLYAYAGTLVAHVPHGAELAPLVRAWLGPTLAGLCAVLIAILAVRGRRAAPLEIALLLLLFTAVRPQTWYALSLSLALLIPRRWAIGVFLGCSLASLVGSPGSPPFVPFSILAAILSTALGLAFAALGAPRRAPAPDRFGGLPQGGV
ncbi:MAG TPA: glycosyltransferase 87 family protein [Candidatus Acidoferrum sp.]|nr:glycosyltransferase 87 family protein [Candidatus Acidoferrum sp.]